jgi:hypothetical protein
VRDAGWTPTTLLRTRGDGGGGGGGGSSGGLSAATFSAVVIVTTVVFIVVNVIIVVVVAAVDPAQTAQLPQAHQIIRFTDFIYVQRRARCVARVFVSVCMCASPPNYKRRYELEENSKNEVKSEAH